MKRIWQAGCVCALLLACALFVGTGAQGEDHKTVQSGIYAGKIDLSGMTKEEALQAVGSFVRSEEHTSELQSLA